MQTRKRWVIFFLCGLGICSSSQGEEGQGSLDAWKGAVSRANAGEQPLVVLLIGDSNTEMNGYAPALRALLQGCYGDGGMGYQPFGKRMQDIPGGATIVKQGEWEELDFAIDPAQPAPPKPWFAPDGLWIATGQSNATVEVKNAGSQAIRLYYQTGPGFGSFRISPEGAKAGERLVQCMTHEAGLAVLG